MSSFVTRMDDAFRFSALETVVGILEKGRRFRLDWNETDNMINVIVPILTMIGFGQFTLAGRKARFSQPVPTPHRPDYEVRGIGTTLAILEAKPFGMPLLARNQSARYLTPFDQVLTYLDLYGDVFAFLTNGPDWCLLRKRHTGSELPEASEPPYLCAMFSLEGSFGRSVDEENLEAFVGMCHASRLFSCYWPDRDVDRYLPWTVSRSGGGASTILLRDFSYGRASIP